MSDGRDNMDGGMDGGAQTRRNHPLQNENRMDGGMDANHDAGRHDAAMDARGVDASVARSDAGADAPNVLRPAYRVINARWLATPVRCGDEVGFRAVVTGYPADTPATVEIFAVGSGTVLTTKNVNIIGGVIQDRYRVYAFSANWRADRIKFRVRVPALSISGESENELAFRNRPTTGWESINQPLSGVAPGTAVDRIYDQCLEAGRVHVSVKVRLTGMPLDSAARLSIKRNIESVWNQGFNPRYKFRRVNCRRGAQCPGDSCNLDFRLDINFVESQPHIAIEMRDATLYDGVSGMNQGRGENTYRTGRDLPTGRRAACAVSRLFDRTGRPAADDCSASVWYYPPATTTSNGVYRDGNITGQSRSIYPHEIGHILGCFDEYFAGTNDPQGYQPYPTSQNQTIPPANQTLMSTTGVTTMLPRFYRYFLWFLNQHTDGDRYVISDTTTNAVYRFP